MTIEQRAAEAVRRHLPQAREAASGLVEGIRDEVIRREQEPHYWASFHKLKAESLRMVGAVASANRKVRRRARRAGREAPPRVKRAQFLWRLRARWHEARMRHFAAHAQAQDPGLAERMGMSQW